MALTECWFARRAAAPSYCYAGTRPRLGLNPDSRYTELFPGDPSKEMSFFAELNRRNVMRVGVAYVVIGWLLVQVAEFAFENFGAPEWVLKTFVVVVLLGLPLALFLAWAFELTPEGVKR